MSSLIPFNAATLKQGAKVAGYVGAGAVAAQVGGRLLKENDDVRAWVGTDALKEAAVDAGGGVIVSGIGLLIAGKVFKGGKAKAAAPFVLGGVLLSAALPALAKFVDEQFDALLDAPAKSSSPIVTGVSSGASLPVTTAPQKQLAAPLPIRQVAQRVPAGDPMSTGARTATSSTRAARRVRMSIPGMAFG